MNNVITIPKTLTMGGELVVIPRSEYDDYLSFKKIISAVKLSRAEKAAIQKGRREIKQGAYLSLREIKNELAC